MAFRLVSSGGNVNDPAMVNMYCSGVVWPGHVVQYDTAAAGTGVSIGASTTTGTNAIGICLDYAQGASDKMVRVVPFTQDQIWEADVNATISTAYIFLRHQLYDSGSVNMTTYNHSGAAGIFFVYNMTGAATGSGKVLGRFLVNNAPFKSGMYNVTG